MDNILISAIERDRRERFLEGANADFAALKERPDDWREYIAERDAMDGAIQDGLKKDELDHCD